MIDEVNIRRAVGLRAGRTGLLALFYCVCQEFLRYNMVILQGVYYNVNNREYERPCMGA